MINHGQSSLLLNKRDNKMFISIKKGNEKIVMTLSIEEALVVGQYLMAYAQARLASQGIYMGFKNKGKDKGSTLPEEDQG